MHRNGLTMHIFIMLSLLMGITTLKPMNLDDGDLHLSLKGVLPCSKVLCICFNGKYKHNLCEACNNIMPLFCRCCNHYTDADRKSWMISSLDDISSHKELSLFNWFCIAKKQNKSVERIEKKVRAVLMEFEEEKNKIIAIDPLFFMEKIEKNSQEDESDYKKVK